MAKTAIQLEVEGLKELQAKSIQMAAAMHGPELATAMRDSVVIMHLRAAAGPPGGRQGPGTTPKGYIPVDTGKLRASLTPVVRSRGPLLQGVVGTNVKYGPVHEFGSKRGHRALEYMKTALKEVSAQVQARFDRAMKLIVKRRPK